VTTNFVLMAPRGPRQSADERRESVLLAAIPEFAIGGLTGTSTETIAARAGISQPYLFRLYPTKKALFVASVSRIFDRVADAFEEAAEGLAGEDALEAMGDAYGALLADRELLMHQMQAYAACDDADVRDATRRGFGRLWGIVERVSGADAERIRRFFAMGMLYNVIAAMDLGGSDARWAVDCLPPQQLPN
jgi:AcrR family transcriptional regulator